MRAGTRKTLLDWVDHVSRLIQKLILYWYIGYSYRYVRTPKAKMSAQYIIILHTTWLECFKVRTGMQGPIQDPRRGLTPSPTHRVSATQCPAEGGRPLTSSSSLHISGPHKYDPFMLRLHLRSHLRLVFFRRNAWSVA